MNKKRTSKYLAFKVANLILDNPDKYDEIIRELKEQLYFYNLKETLPHLLGEVSQIIKDKRKSRQAVFTTSHFVSPSLAKEATSVITKGKEESLEVVENKNLLGGFIIEYDYKMTDRSFRSRLNNLRQQILNS